MESSVLVDLALQRLREPSLWWLVGVVGLLINLYGQVLVPWLRGIDSLDAVRREARTRPGLLFSSVLLAFLFPLLVSLVSSVTAGRAVRDAASICRPERR